MPGLSNLDGRARRFANEEQHVSAVIEHLEGEARERLILWLRRRMLACNITLEALEDALAHDIDELKAVRYRDARGNTWTGLGEPPEWLRRAIAAGQSIDHFLCD
jgi:DNA-binding protein H-NS